MAALEERVALLSILLHTAGRAVRFRGNPWEDGQEGWAEEKNGKEDKLEPMQSRAEKWEYFFDALQEHKLDRAPLEST